MLNYFCIIYYQKYNNVLSDLSKCDQNIFIYKYMEKYNNIINKLKNNNIEIKTDIIIDDNNDTITSRIDGTQRKRIYGRYLKSLGITSEEYKYLFPDAPLMCQSDSSKTTKNSGQHMKTEKYKKMFSEKIKGDKNPNHKSKTTENERKSRSPFSSSFIKYNNEEERKDFVKHALKDRVLTTNINYYLKRGMSLEDAKVKLSERQRTFTIDKCVEKYGEVQGMDVFKNRQQKWQKSLLDNGNLKCGYSNISQDLFINITKFYNKEDLNYINYATKNKEYYICEGKGEFYQYDFTDIKRKKIIEYNGDQYHANPKMFEADETPHPFRKTITSEEIWEKDSKKHNTAKEHGFGVLIVWDSEYKSNKELTIKKCVDFLFNKN